MATGGTTNINTSSGGGGINALNVNLQLLQTFHQRCGRRITLSNGNRTATRSARDFSHALVFSAEPLLDDVLFEVVIEKKVRAAIALSFFFWFIDFYTNTNICK